MFDCALIQLPRCRAVYSFAPVLPALQDVATEQEPWYGTQYSKERVPAGWLERWEAAAPPPELHLPRRNRFIPTDFALLQARALACSGT